MGPGVSQPVPVRRAAAQVTALLPGLRRYLGTHPDPGPRDLPLGLHPQHQHGLLVVLSAEVDTAADLRGPQLDAIVLKQRRHRRILTPVEGPLVFPDHDRLPAPVRISQPGHKSRRLRAARPRQGPAVPDIEELGHDPPMPGHQRSGLVPLPRPRRDRILPVLSRHPPVESEPQPAAGRHGNTAPPGALRPRRQRIPSRDSFRMTQITHGPPAGGVVAG